jgi:hypothetical protein
MLSRERFCPSPKASEGQLHSKHADRCWDITPKALR